MNKYYIFVTNLLFLRAYNNLVEERLTEPLHLKDARMLPTDELIPQSVLN